MISAEKFLLYCAVITGIAIAFFVADTMFPVSVSNNTVTINNIQRYGTSITDLVSTDCGVYIADESVSVQVRAGDIAVVEVSRYIVDPWVFSPTGPRITKVLSVNGRNAKTCIGG